VNFCPWYALADAGAHAPSTPGVFQVRIARGLLDYPRGKSAMIHYGLGQDVRAAAQAFAAAHPGVDWLCRHAEELTARERALGLEAAFEAAFEALVGSFVQRFGTPPRLP
jgi:hypothetical protein